MSPEPFDRILRILQRALELAREERASYLDDACGADRELRSEVESLLLARGDSADIPGKAEKTWNLSDLSGDPLVGVPSESPRAIGPYKILGVLGEGGTSSDLPDRLRSHLIEAFLGQ